MGLRLVKRFESCLQVLILIVSVTCDYSAESSLPGGDAYNHLDLNYNNGHQTNEPCAQIFFEDEILYQYQDKFPYHLPCIPISAINDAFTKARLRYGILRPIQFDSINLDKSLSKIDQLGHVLLETSRIIADHFQLDSETIFSLLPKIDVNQTDIVKYCPFPVVTPAHLTCKTSKYRTLTGHCNNFQHPNWGAAFTPFQNFLPPIHADGISEPRESLTSSLPSPRLVSHLIHQNPSIMHDHAITTMLIAWGQIIDHDITLTADTQDPSTFKEPECCQHLSHHNCLPIEIPRSDQFYSVYGQTCMNFARSLAGLRTDCRLGTRKAFNRISSFLDGNFIYGSNEQLLNNQLRLGQHGLLRTVSLPAFKRLGLKGLLPMSTDNPNDGCIRSQHQQRLSKQYCFLAGDIRVNEQLILTVLHTIFMREHNRIAKKLGTINPHWDDERLFQETRRIVIAIIQHITFNEFLPMTLGKNIMQRYGLILERRGHFWNGYEPSLDATAAEEFITSAFRFGHSLLPHKIERWSSSHRFIDSQQLHRLLRQPFDLYKPGHVDTYVLGLVNQLAQAMDEGVTDQVTTLLFKEPKQHFGMDLAAINIQRGREHGVPSYTSYRNLCKLSAIYDWHDLQGIFRNETIHKYQSIYWSPHDIDLWSGGVSELPEEDSLLGPTFNCIIGRQFYLVRAGDRFWYETPHQPNSFTIGQLDEIRTVTLARLLCDNTDNVKTMQLYAMVYPDFVINPRVSCKGQIIPSINFERWREAFYPEEAKVHVNNASASATALNELESYLPDPAGFPVPVPLQHLHLHPLAYDDEGGYYQHDYRVDFNINNTTNNNGDHQYFPHSSITSTAGITGYGSSSSSGNEVVGNDYNQHQKQHHLHGYNNGFQPTNVYDNTLIIKTPTQQPQPAAARQQFKQSSSSVPAKNQFQHQIQPSSSSLLPNSSEEPSPYDQRQHPPEPTLHMSAPHLHSPQSQLQFHSPAQTTSTDPFVINDITFISKTPVPLVLPKKEILVKEPLHLTPTVTRRHFIPRRLPQSYPNSPFPGWDGLFSPNPGYLVRQQFRIAKG